VPKIRIAAFGRVRILEELMRGLIRDYEGVYQGCPEKVREAVDIKHG
jgi:hypothetical protein